MSKAWHYLGLAVVLLLIFFGYWAWTAYPGLARLPGFGAWRSMLTTWRIPVFALGTFLLLSLLQWFWSRINAPEDS